MVLGVRRYLRAKRLLGSGEFWLPRVSEKIGTPSLQNQVNS